MNPSFDDIPLIDLLDAPPQGAAWDAWLAAHPDAAEELETARRVRLFLSRLHDAEVSVSPDFEARLMVRLRTDRTLLDLLDLGLAGMLEFVMELLNGLFALLPSSDDEGAHATA